MLKNLLVAIFMLVLIAPASVSATENHINHTQELCASDQAEHYEVCQEDEEECECEQEPVECDETEKKVEDTCVALEVVETPEEPVEEPEEEAAPQVLAETTPEPAPAVLAATGVNTTATMFVGLLLTTAVLYVTNTKQIES